MRLKKTVKSFKDYLYKQEEKFQDFQYILTLNRDKIESEERRKLIKMDIDLHCVATFTKDKKEI